MCTWTCPRVAFSALEVATVRVNIYPSSTQGCLVKHHYAVRHVCNGIDK